MTVLVLSIIRIHIHGIKQCVFICDWLLSFSMFLRFTMMFCNSGFFLLLVSVSMCSYKGIPKAG